MNYSPNYSMDDTIAAIATPPGAGGVGIVRISGKSSLEILQKITADDLSRQPVYKPRYLRHGWVYTVDANGVRERLDEVLAVHMPGPASFTGEDVAEIHCHGGRAVPLAILASVCRLGARPAEKGEFTYRAFVNGKYDLTQAEAVAEMIAAPSRQGLRLAQAKLSGLLGRRVETLREEVERLRAVTLLAMDFPDDEAEAAGMQEFAEGLETVKAGLLALLTGYKRARFWREGVSVILVGRVNAGKSSLLNALLGRNRAIVSATPGTTRDFIEESLDLDGLNVRIADTAGLRSSEDPVEMEGVSRAKELAGEAELVVLVTDVSCGLTKDEQDFLTRHRGRIFVVRNKIDLLPAEDAQKELARNEFKGVPAAAVSAREGTGLESLAFSLRRAVLEVCGASGEEPAEGDIVPNMRQSELLAAALDAIEGLIADMADGVPCDIFSVRLDAAAMHLGEVTGFAATDDILGRIFSSFCIGK